MTLACDVTKWRRASRPVSRAVSHNYGPQDLKKKEICVSLRDVIAYVQGPVILGMGSANEGRCYNVTSPLIGSAHTQNDPWIRVLSFDLVKSRSGEIGSLSYRFEIWQATRQQWYRDSTAAETPVKFESNRTMLNANLKTSTLCKTS